MSVIVKDMEMPGACWDCVMSRFDVCKAVGRTYDPDPGQPKRPDWCPLVPMPEKHGRLIDADALHALYESRWHDLQVLNLDENPHAEDIQTGVNWCINTLHDDLPIIVEAEGDDG